MKHNHWIVWGLALLLLLSGCKAGATGQAAPFPSLVAEAAAETEPPAEPAPDAAPASQMAALADPLSPRHLGDDYRNTYEIFVYSFCDSDADGVGDLNGVREKLDYINDMGFDQIWLMPIFPSPTYHKYDARDYTDIDPEYGTLEDFDALLAACHQRGIRVILDLALNHTSTEHPWFQAAAQYLLSLPEGQEPDATACPFVSYYSFQRTPQSGYVSLGNGWYYEARFWGGMPDLNLGNEAVRNEITAFSRFWLDRGVDGFRLDALTSYYSENKGDSIAFLGWFTDMVKGIAPDAYLVGECWADQSTYAEYYDSGIDSLFDFQFAGDSGVLCSVVRGTRSASVYGEAMAAEEALYAQHNPNYVNAPFYTNHDMARSAGYYAYDDGSRTKMAQGLNLLMTGNAFVYYGEELGMRGSGKDENKRAPMFWSETETEGMCRGPLDMETVKMKFPAADAQMADPQSIYSYVKTALRIRNSFPAIARGKTIPVDRMSNASVSAFLREYGEERLLIVCNMGKTATSVPLAGKGLSFRHLTAVLLTGTDEVVLKRGMVKLPPFSIAILTEEQP